MKEISEAEMLSRAAAYCSTAERCQQEVETKIRNAGLTAEAAQRIMQRLTDEGFIDEERFCRSFVNDKLRFNKWGKIKIGYELRKKNIPPSIQSEALDGIDENLYVEILRDLLRDKKKNIKARDPREQSYKLMRFAAGRGFETELILKCLRQSNDEEEIYPEDLE